MVGYSILYEVRLTIYHMTYNMVGYSILYEVRLKMYHMTYNMVGYSILYEVRLNNVSYDIQYGGVLYPV